MKIIRPAVLLLSLLSSSALHAASKNAIDTCPDFPAPKTARLQSVAQQMDFNDVPMRIQRFDSKDAPETILAFYRDKWASKEKAQQPIEYPLGDWKVIASYRDSCFFTVQVMGDGRGGSTGFLGVSAPPSETPVVKDDVPLLTGSNVVNDIGHKDGGKVGRTMLITNGFSAETNASFYRNAYTGNGWKVVTDYNMEKDGGRGNVLVMKNGLREMSMTATRSGTGSRVLLNFVNQP